MNVPQALPAQTAKLPKLSMGTALLAGLMLIESIETSGTAFLIVRHATVRTCAAALRFPVTHAMARNGDGNN